MEEQQQRALRMPGVVIIDLDKDIQSFHLVAGSMKTHTCLEETLCRIMAKIAEDQSADLALTELKTDIVNDHRRAGADLEGEMYARVALTLGQRLLKEIRQSELYMPDGTLNYYFHSMLRKTTVILHEGSPIELGGETNELAG